MKMSTLLGNPLKNGPNFGKSCSTSVCSRYPENSFTKSNSTSSTNCCFKFNNGSKTILRRWARTVPTAGGEGAQGARDRDTRTEMVGHTGDQGW